MANRVLVLPKDVEHGLIPILVVLVTALRPHRRRKRRGVAVIMGAVAVAGGGEQLKLVPAARVRPSGESCDRRPGRSEEHTSELQSLMRTSYAVFCLKKKI